MGEGKPSRRARDDLETQSVDRDDGGGHDLTLYLTFQNFNTVLGGLRLWDNRASRVPKSALVVRGRALNYKRPDMGRIPRLRTSCHLWKDTEV